MQNVDLLNPMFLTSIDETSWKSLSGVRVNQRILQLVPNLEVVCSILSSFYSFQNKKNLENCAKRAIICDVVEMLFDIFYLGSTDPC